MIYLEFIDWQDYIELLTAENMAFTRLDILDASTPGHYQFHAVATQFVPKHGVIAICSTLIHDADEPDFAAGCHESALDKARAEFSRQLAASLTQSRADIAALFKQAKLRVRAGLYSIEPPPILKLRK